MFRLLIDDAIDLLRFRVKPLEAYQYPAWLPALALTLLAVIGSAGASDLGDDIGGRMTFLVLFTWLETLCFAQFMGVWLRLAKWKQTGSLFGLIVVANALQFVEPLTSWLPDQGAMVADMVLSLIEVMVLINALAQVSGVSRLRVLLGILLFSPLALVLLAASLSLASAQGWVKLPADLMQSVQGASSGGASKAF